MLADEIPVTLDWYLNRDILGNPRFDYFGNQGTNINPLYVIKYGKDNTLKLYSIRRRKNDDTKI